MDFEKFSKIVLFDGMEAEEIKELLDFLHAEKRFYKKGETIYRMGDKAAAMGIVLKGSVLIENDDAWGNRSILDKVDAGKIFAETYACAPEEKMMVNVVSAEESELLFLNLRRIFAPGKLKAGKRDEPHGGDRERNAALSALCERAVRNLLFIFLQKNLNLSRRIFHTSSKSIRGRLLSYLSYQSVQTGSNEFDIPFNRQQLADYLGVDRSAMSNEISKMQRDGLIRVRKNHFLLLTSSAVSL